jgi:hypothetical protein
MEQQNTIDKITRSLNIDYHTFKHESTRYFLERKLRDVTSGIFNICGKYNIQSIQQFDELYIQGKLEEHTTMEDYKKLDRLEYQRDTLKNLLTELKND